MKKIALTLAITAALGVTATTASAANLSIDAGSNFTMEVAPGFHLPTAIIGANGIDTEAASSNATGSHSGAPTGAEGFNIDAPWSFFSNTGMHGASGPLTMTANGDGTASMDMSTWYVTWNGIPVIDMGSGVTADITCTDDVNCASGAYTLTYNARVPAGDPSSFGNVAYGLNLVGTISAVPVPAAAWLFGSGLLGLVGVARRKANA